KLSKRHGARAVIEYQEDGLLPHALVNCLVRLGWSHGDKELFSMQELLELFDGESLNSAASAFDPEKLQWFNAHYLRETPLDALARLTLPFVVKEGFADVSVATLERLLPLYRERATNLVELAKGLTMLLVKASELAYDAAAVAKALTPEGKAHVTALRACLATLPDLNKEAAEQAIHSYVEAAGVKFKVVAQPLRVALTGSLGGPGLPDVMDAIGSAETLARLDRAVTL
ncbi:MAG: glutamate--tRNA ligase family protein, partial [Bilophila sp.]